MKKIITILTSVMAIVVLSVMMAACSKSVEGSWKFSSLTTTRTGGTVYETKVGDERTASDGTKTTVGSDYVTIEIKKDNTYSLSVNGEEKHGTWEKKDGKYITHSENGDGKPMEWELDGKTLIILWGGDDFTMRIVMVK